MRIFPVWLVLSVLVLSSCKDHPTTIKFPDGLEVVTVGVNTKTPCRECPKKFIGYLDLTQRGLFFLEMNSKVWEDLETNYPELEVIWVFGGESEKIDKDGLKRLLEEMSYPYSVLYDEGNKFYELNQLENIPYEVKAIQCYFVDGEDVIINAAPGVPEFQKQLSEFLDLEKSD